MVHGLVLGRNMWFVDIKPEQAESNTRLVIELNIHICIQVEQIRLISFGGIECAK